MYYKCSMIKDHPLIKQSFNITEQDKVKEKETFEKLYLETEKKYKKLIDFSLNENWNENGFYSTQCKSKTFEKLKRKGRFNFNIFFFLKKLFQKKGNTNNLFLYNYLKPVGIFNSLSIKKIIEQLLEENFSKEIKTIFKSKDYEVAFVILHDTNAENSNVHFDHGDNSNRKNHKDVYHVDTILPNSIKCMFYLSDNVSSESGAFRYVPGSYKFNQEPKDWITRYVIRNFYHGTDKSTLKKFYSLEKTYQKRPHFLYLNDDITYKNKIDELATIFSSPTNMIMFNANGIHNGGFVYKGRRKALQILIIPKDKNDK